MPARILIADDSPLMLKTLRNLLESQSEDWEICAEAADGPQTLEKALKAKPDLIIIDFQMPLMDGLSVASTVGKLLPKTRIVIHTMHKSKFLDAKAERAGVRAVISKSDTGMLLSTIHDLLDEAEISPQSGENGATI